MVMEMRNITKEEIYYNVKSAIKEIGYKLDCDFVELVKEQIGNCNNNLEKSVLEDILKNEKIAQQKQIPLCQDTGMVNIFLSIGRDIHFDFDIDEVINQAVSDTYLEEKYRLSVVTPLDRINTLNNTPAIIHHHIVVGDKIKVYLMLKGGGSENMSLFKMLSPTASKEDIILELVNHFKYVSSKACPPYLVGISLGGDFESAAINAKKALFNDGEMNELELEIMNRINSLDIGPIGSGGKTVYKVSLNLEPTHIASLPLAISICCSSVRKKVFTI